MTNEFAAALGRLGKGKKKRLSKAERKRRGERGAKAWREYNAKRKLESSMPDVSKGV